MGESEFYVIIRWVIWLPIALIIILRWRKSKKQKGKKEGEDNVNNSE